MDPPSKMASQTASLFQVYLRLRPSIYAPLPQPKSEPWLIVEPSATPSLQDEDSKAPSQPTHVTLQPPNESRKRAIERFGFTKIFQEEATQLEIFDGIGTVDSIRSLLQSGRDGLIATLGVTGSGKSHTTLGSKTQRGLTQMTLDVLFRSIGENIRRSDDPHAPADKDVLSVLQASDPSEGQILSATTFLESFYGDGERARLSRAQTPMSRAPTPMTDTAHHVRRPPLPRPSTFARDPDVSSHSIDIDRHSEYVVLISMYEVYNDRIFDLLSNPTAANAPPMTTRQGAALQKGLLRRPLLFKNTEASPDRKVVAGLRKIVCGSYDEAIMVLETGLTERRVAGTGSNSVSSRSHGFFCIEVKKRRPVQNYGHGSSPWIGGTVSIVDLAGSERARSAKTTGSTLAEAGKINESLMYLGQCLQVQSDCQQDGSKPIVPFRQCKLTELLFSNSFPSSTNPAAACRAPQKAVMIVTADPHGDFNATSQILRYSALAREVTVPRVPSVTSTIWGAAAAHQGKLAAGTSSGRSTPHDIPPMSLIQGLEQATNEVARLTEECDGLALRLSDQEIKRTEVELQLQAAEEKMAVAEQQIREECWAEMDAQIEEEKQRWRAAWEQEKLRGEEYLDGKLDILEKTATFNIYQDTSPETRLEELERENQTLRAQLRALEQEMQMRSPTKKGGRAAPRATSKAALILQETSNSNIATNPFLASLRTRDSDATIKPSVDDCSMNLCDGPPPKLSLNALRIAGGDDQGPPPQTPMKKQRKLTTRKWDLADPEELGF